MLFDRDAIDVIAGMGIQILEADLLAAGDLIRHAPRKLTEAVLSLAASEAFR